MARVDFKINLAWLLLLIVISGQSARADWHEEEYWLPLFGSYNIHRDDAQIPNQQAGRFQLVKFRPDSGYASDVENLKTFAVSGHIIVGTTETDYFLIDTSQPFPSEGQRFDDAERWKAALAAAGIPSSILLNDPTTMTFQHLQPVRVFHYRAMKKLFGLSDEDWGGIVGLTSLAIIFLRGLLMRQNASLFPLALLLAWSATVALIVSNVLDVGGFGGFIVYPGLYWLVGKFGRFCRRFIWDAAMRRRVQGPLSPV